MSVNITLVVNFMFNFDAAIVWIVRAALAGRKPFKLTPSPSASIETMIMIPITR